jgi:glycosyltransferase involved in cell wall biosynthesis
MKVTVIVPGRLHGFDLGRHLQEQGALRQLITGYPRFEVTRWGIRRELVTSLYVNEIINRGTHYLFRDYRYDFVACEAFDRLAALVVNADSDVYIIWSSYALHTIRKIRKANPGAVIILERGSAHIAVQNELLASLSGKPAINRGIIGKEIAEYALADYINVPSLFAQRTFLAKGVPAEKVTVNNLGVDLKDFSQAERSFAAGEKFVIGFVGSMSARKNVAGLIAAVGRLVEKGLDVELHLVGTVDHASFDASVFDRYGFIKYKGVFPQQELGQAYRQMHVFVLNSVEDGFGLVILQAMSTGLPVIATEHTGGPDVITEGSTGFVIPVNDTDALSERIERLYHDREQCRRMGKAARLATESGFSWTDYGKRYLELIDRVSHAAVPE